MECRWPPRSHALCAPLDVVVVRKVGAPENPEYGIGALGEGGASVIDEEAVEQQGIGTEELRTILAHAHDELNERIERYRGTRAPVPLEGRTVLLVDDGLATGRTAQAAAQCLRQRGAARIVLAVPVAARSAVREPLDGVDEVVDVHAPAAMWAIGFWYDDFRPTSDEEVAMLLDEHGPASACWRVRSRSEADPGVILTGDLALPTSACAVVAFAHGSGSSRLSPRNRSVARALGRGGDGNAAPGPADAGGGGRSRERLRHPAARAAAAGRHALVLAQPQTRELPVGYFGASTGAAAALIAAAEAGERTSAVVSRGGLADLAIPRLAEVTAPTLLIVGGHDVEVLELNREAQEHLRCINRLAVVPDASHLFEEPGALEQVADLAIGWFHRYSLAAPPL